MLAFNKKFYKTILCNISIIANEITLYNHLKTKYNFKQNRIAIDYSKLYYYL